MAKSTRLAFLVLLAGLACLDASAGRVNPSLEAQLKGKPSGELIPIIVELESQANPSNAVKGVDRRDRPGRGRAVVNALRDVSGKSQKPVIDAIAAERAQGNAGDVKSFFIFNGLATKANEKAIRRLAARGDVREVRYDRAIAPPRLKLSNTPVGPDTMVYWNIDKVHSPDVWALNPNYDGTGVVVGSFDTGVDYTHPDLSPRYRGNDAISWFDPYGEHSTPYDNNGHGTHTTGTAVGGDASGAFIGVAPGARWIAAKGWDDSDNATVSSFHQVFQWFLAPGGDPANAPDVVNNSWGMSPPDCYNDFQADVQAWRAAGILPVFASGNEGPGPSTVLSPGNYAESYAVGATDPDDVVADFSGQGPSQCDGEIKPDIAAPGVGVFSSLPGGDWYELDGTSMATPHVTGAAAVLLSIDPTLDPDALESALSLGAQDIGDPGVDNLSGVGRLDVLSSASIVLGIPMVGVRPTIPKAYEAGTVPGKFTVTRRGSTTDPLTLTYTVTGTATPGDDYVALPGTITLAPGATSADIVVNPIDDTLVELDETVIVTLAPSTGYITSPASATVTVVSDELLPDMTVLSLTVPSTGGAGLAMTVNDTTKNTGPGVAPATVTRYYLSTNTTLDAGDVVIGSRSVAALASNASDAGSVTLTIPAGTATGSYYVIAKADATDATVEVTEDNNATARFVAIGPDLTVWNLTTTPSGAGQPITLTDTIRNIGGGNAAATNTRFYLSTNTTLEAGDVLLGSRAVAALAPGASDTGSVTLTIPAGTPSGAYYILAKADGDDTLAETSETNNLGNKSINLGADLAVTNLVYPGLAGAGLPITITDTVQNIGGGPAPASRTKLFLSNDTVLDAGDVLLGARNVGAIAAGASDTGSVTLTIPAGTATGYYYLIAKADGDDAIGETNELNNTLVRVLTIGPDLVLTAFTAPSGAGAGQPLTVSDTTKNLGGGNTPATTTRYYLSTDTVLDASDVMVGGRSVAALSQNASDSGSATVTIPAGTATGTYYLFAKADGDNAVTETTETNNTLYRTVTVGPDLTVSALGAPATAGAGTAIVVTDTTNNVSGAAVPATNTRFYLSVNATLDAGDVLLGSRAVPALAAGAASSGSATVTIPASTAGGNYYIIAKADGDDALSEISETNNFATRAITIGPDLVVTGVTASAGGAGLPMTVSDTVRNQGGGTAPPTTTRYYLSVDSILDGSDIALGGRTTGSIASGASDTGSITVAIPAGTASGSYYIIAKADGDNALVETNEANNTFAKSVNIGPDLTVTNLAYPSIAGAGLAISVSDTVQNLGGGTAAATNTRFYLSVNATLDAGDVYLGSRAVGAIAPNATDTGSATITIPAGTATGYYYLIAKADGDDALAETNELNNALVRVITIGPDLVLTALTAPSTAGGGQSITVSDTTRNSGGGSTTATTTRYYLSTNGTLDAGDVLLGARSVAALAPSAQDSGSATVTIPAGTASGTYYIIAKADGDDSLPETSETNNTLARGISIGPDLLVSSFTAPNVGGAGLPLTVTDTTTNAGGAAPPSNTRYYLSTNGVLDAGDIPLGSRSVGALAAGAADTGSATITIPAGTANGAYYLLAKADGDDAIVELSETNNVLSRSITIGPDLTVTSVTAPNGGAGQSMTVSDTVKNLGGGTAAATNTRYYLSTNASLDAGDTLLGSRAVASLAPGATDTGSVVVTIPAGTASGSYYILAVADGDNTLAETSEANNVFAKSISIGPNLVVSNLAYPSAAGQGTSITITDTTQNLGGGAAPTTTTRYYLSANTALDASDVLLGGRSVAALAAGTSDTGSVSITIPAGTAAGYYYLLAKADGTDAVGETYEGDNVLVRVIQVTP